jgi:uncharacterized protein YlxW (UPF0749 family)
MRKQVTAFLAAFLISACVALVMLAIGASAMFNPNGVAAANSSASSAVNVSNTTNSASTQQQVAQLQAQVAQYQAREQQYQTALNNDNQQLTQATREMQMVQQLLIYLQNHGLITIDSQGQITVIGGSGN